MRPYINIIENFDANKDYVLDFTYLGAERITTNQVQIREAVSGSTPVYDRMSTKFDKDHTIPANTLVNGKSYWVKLRVQLNETTWTEWSVEVEFVCLATPVLTFDSLDNKSYVYNNDILMSVIYRQEQGEKVETFQFTLMNQNKVPLTKYPTRVPDSQSPNLFTERIGGLVKGRLYYIGVRITTQNGINFYDYHEFIPHFVTPSLDGMIAVKNNGEAGQVLVQSYLKQLLGTQTKPFIPDALDDSPTNYTYVDDEWIVVPKSMPLMYTRLGMAKASDFVTKLWAKSVPNGTLLHFAGELGTGVNMKFVKHDNYITCEKEHNGIKSRTRSNVVEGFGSGEFYLYIKVVEYRVQMTIVPITN